MFGILFKFSLAFIFSYIILSFQIQNKPIFYHISELTGPLGVEVQKSLSKSVKRTITQSKEMGKDLFENADPVYLKDSIKSSQSSLFNQQDSELILEEIKKEETKKLDELINKN
ncbi:MAG: hypothetical protein QF441_12230 [Bacteriovoracaceae bacterium]|jgi:hypothetical protein|nr:hypothetical protein [Halobacteriovoraceae bacterium]MDP7321373.1 hypothetical protein [Bacteriovoracaceae bacterium]